MLNRKSINTTFILLLLIMSLMFACQAQTNTETGETFDTTAGIQAAQWGENVIITFNNNTFQYESNGYPNHDLPEKFLIPININSQPFSDDTLEDFNVALTEEYLTESPVNVTITLQPSYANEVQETSLGQIGFIISGARLFNDYENMERTVVALDDNISFDFDDAGHDHAAFVDDCNGHPLQDGSNYHYHGVPTCVIATVDVAGEHSRIIGVLQDGFPVYGDKGEGGVTLTNADLDECSGHFGATPEFSDGIYHYHLTQDEAPYSIDCYKGNVDNATGNTRGLGGADSPPQRNGEPDFAAAATTLGISEDDLRNALGVPPPDFEAAAATLGISVEELQDAMGGVPPRN